METQTRITQLVGLCVPAISAACSRKVRTGHWTGGVLGAGAVLFAWSASVALGAVHLQVGQASTYPNSTGDCNGDGRVRVSEIERMAAIALGAAPLSSCRRADPSGDGQVSVEELVSAVNVSL